MTRQMRTPRGVARVSYAKPAISIPADDSCVIVDQLVHIRKRLAVIDSWQVGTMREMKDQLRVKDIEIEKLKAALAAIDASKANGQWQMIDGHRSLFDIVFGRYPR